MPTGDESDRRSYTGYVFTLGDAVINRETKKTTNNTLSNGNRYMAEGAKKTVHRRNIFLELFEKDMTIKMYTNNQSAMKLV